MSDAIKVASGPSRRPTWPTGGWFGLARVRVRVTVRVMGRVIVSAKDRTWPKSERPTCPVQTDAASSVGAPPPGGRFGLARVKVSRVRVSVVRVSRVRAWPKSERPTCRMPSEWPQSSGSPLLARRRQVRASQG